jgi:hypothetical protein
LTEAEQPVPHAAEREKLSPDMLASPVRDAKFIDTASLNVVLLTSRFMLWETTTVSMPTLSPSSIVTRLGSFAQENVLLFRLSPTLTHGEESLEDAAAPGASAAG